ncbi:putative quinol monooxygenase [Burkholderia sp. TSV86]|uniref:putative quinol monooxygenase n=1 Tax=Burkholderia sp. TSV86 TaxID=1385594 RepID=UPI0009E8233A|nr:antibiotic biosynthesis monooxygenase [Burkholderia sp. TSV86]
MKSVTVVAFLSAPIGKETALFERLCELVPATRAEPGCLDFTAHRHAQIANRFVVYEKFQNRTAFDAHLEYAHTRSFVAWVQANDVALNFELWDELA